MKPIELELQMQRKMFELDKNPMLGKPDELVEDEIEMIQLERYMNDDHDCHAGPEDGCQGCVERDNFLNKNK